MQISSVHLAGKPKKIGTLEGNPIMELSTTGGLHVVAVARGGKSEVLGAGPHRAVARHLALKKEPSIKLTDLAKADHVPEAMFSFVLPKYEQLTADLRRAQGLE